MASNTTASLVVLNFNGRHLLAECLPSVVAAAAGPQHEVIVVDNGSRDGSVEFVRVHFPQAKLFPLPRNFCFSRANNIAAAASRGDVLIFLNNDMRPEPDFLPPLLAHFADPQVFQVSCHILMPPKLVDGQPVQETGLVRGRFETGVFRLIHEQPHDPQAVPVFYAGGGSCACARDKFFALGGFDELYFPIYFEDLDLSYRAQKRGWKVLWEPRSRVHHKHQATMRSGRYSRRFVQLAFRQGELLFHWRNLADRRLLIAHLWHLWRRLASPAADPVLQGGFYRALARLPRVLLRRRRDRHAQVCSDRQVLAASGPPAPPPTPAPLPAPASAPPFSAPLFPLFRRALLRPHRALLAALQVGTFAGLVALVGLFLAAEAATDVRASSPRRLRVMARE